MNRYEYSEPDYPDCIPFWSVFLFILMLGVAMSYGCFFGGIWIIINVIGRGGRVILCLFGWPRQQSYEGGCSMRKSKKLPLEPSEDDRREAMELAEQSPAWVNWFIPLLTAALLATLSWLGVMHHWGLLKLVLAIVMGAVAAFALFLRCMRQLGGW